MDQNQLNRFRQRLFEEQRRLDSEVKRSEQGFVENQQPPGELSNNPTHAADQDAEGVDKRIVVQDTIRAELRDVDAALERIEAGTYGKCVLCGKEISQERLEALPQTPHCIDCEREQEKAEMGIEE